MKKLVTIAILITLLMMTVSSALVVSAQEPTSDELTEEPTVEPTEEPTEEPTVEPADTDGDGVPDDTDQCPDTPEGTEVDEVGCPVPADTDGDGVPDDADQCPDTPEGTEVDEVGCPVPPTDTPEPTEEPTVEPTEEPTVEPTEEPTPEPTEEPTVEPTEEPTPEPTEEPTVEATATITPTVELTGEKVEAAGALPGSFTTKIIAVANIDSSPANIAIDLYPVGGGSSFQIGTGNPTVPVGGANIYRNTDPDWTSDGQFSGVINSSAQVAAAVLTENSSARTADAYPGFNTPDTTLYGPRIFNAHYTWESILHCQNAGSGTATIYADLYKAGEATPRITLQANVDENKSTSWDIVDDAAAQAAWPGGNDQFGYVRFRSANPIACVVDNQKMSSPYVQSQYNAVPPFYADDELYAPLVFHGHGASPENIKGEKWNSGVSIVNISATAANVQVVYTSGSYVKTCTMTIYPNENRNWYAPQVGTGPDGWSCTPSGPLTWYYPGGPTYGSIKITSNVDIIAVNNSQIYNSTIGAGYSSIPATPGVATTNRVVCPVSFNESTWLGGVRTMNVGTAATGDVTYTMVRANVNPSGNSVNIVKPSLNPGEGTSCYFPQEPTAFTSFQGVVFVSAANSSAQIAASSSNQTAPGVPLESAAMYDCINY